MGCSRGVATLSSLRDAQSGELASSTSGRHNGGQAPYSLSLFCFGYFGGFRTLLALKDAAGEAVCENSDRGLLPYSANETCIGLSTRGTR